LFTISPKKEDLPTIQHTVSAIVATPKHQSAIYSNSGQRHGKRKQFPGPLLFALSPVLIEPKFERVSLFAAQTLFRGALP